MIPVDGLWIDMNEPSNFCNGECKSLLATATMMFIRNATKPLLATSRVQSLTDPPYYINNQGSKAVLNTKTIDPDAVQSGTTHYNAHNLFGMLIFFLPLVKQGHKYVIMQTIIIKFRPSDLVLAVSEFFVAQLDLMQVSQKP